jgi:predicted nucleotide-binding protein
VGCSHAYGLTPDDIGASRTSPDKPNPRARQNVILELGYFIGKLGRAKVCAIYAEGVEVPSDIHGVLYIPFDAEGAWRWKLATEIRAAGIAVDLNRI